MQEKTDLRKLGMLEVGEPDVAKPGTSTVEALCPGPAAVGPKEHAYMETEPREHPVLPRSGPRLQCRS